MMDREHGRLDRGGVTPRIFILLVVVLSAWGFADWLNDTRGAWRGVGVFLACHGSMALGAWCAAGRILARRRSLCWSTVSLLLTGQLYFACLGGLGLLLGCCGMFTPPYAMGAAGLAGLILVFWGRRHACMTMPLLSRRPLLAIVQIVTLSFVVLVAFKCVLAPEYDYDVLTYHLLFPARWVQDGAISVVPTWFGDPAPAYAPSLTEVYYAWLMLPFRGDVLARCGQFPFYVMLLIASGGVAAELRLPRSVRAWLPLAAGLVPAILAQAATAMVDVALAAHLVCAVYFALRCRGRGRIGDLVGLILALGLLAGTKFIALPFGLALLPLVAYALWQWFRCGGRSSRAWVAYALGALVLSAWVGGFWYVRNAVLTANPLYPLETRIGGTVVFDGAYGREQMENSVFNVRRRASASAFGETLWGILHLPSARPEQDETGGAQALREWHRGPAGAVLLAYVLGVVGLLRTKDRRRWRAGLYYLTGGLLFAVFWFVLPFQQSRFALGIVPLAIAGAAGAVLLHRRMRWAVLVLWVGLWTGTFGTEWQTWFSPVFGASSRAEDPRLAAMEDSRWQTLREAWLAIDEELHGVTIAYAGNNVPYFLCGRRLENRVVYVPARQPAAGRFHDFAVLPETRALGRPNTSEPACDRYVMSPDAWCENLAALDVDYVLVTAIFPNLLPNYRHDREGFTIERQWLDRLCESADGNGPWVECRVFGGGAARLYRRNRDAWPATIAGFPRIEREETDALGLLENPLTQDDTLRRLYPYAGAFISQTSLTPLK